jgi:hypothetical protein
MLFLSRSPDQTSKGAPMFHRSRQALPALSVVLAVCVVLTGCGGKLTKANAEKIKVGMTEAEVKAILGEPKVSADTDKQDTPPAEKSGIRQLTWKESDRTISISFKDGKVHAAPVTSGL